MRVKKQKAPIWKTNPVIRTARPILSWLMCVAGSCWKRRADPALWVIKQMISTKTKTLVIMVCEIKVDSGPT